MKVEQLTIPIQIRNRDLIPHLENEGYFWKPLPIPKQTDLHQQQQQKRAPLQAHRRLFYHQTLNSARKTVLYQPFEQCVAHDSLDFVLASVYNDKIKLHANKADVLMQMETKGHQTARRLKNTIDINPEHIPVLGHPLQIGKDFKCDN